MEELVARLIERLENNPFIEPFDLKDHLAWHLDGATEEDIQDLLERSDLSLWLSGRDGLERESFVEHISRMERLGKGI